MTNGPPSPILFLDFDGTISQLDVTDVILEQYADDVWRDIEAEWRSGRVGSRDCLREQMALVRATRAQLDDLIDAIEVDAGFAGLLALCQAESIELHVISDGFDYCIDRILARAVNVQRSAIAGVHASHLDLNRRPWRTEYPFFNQSCAHGCATCKPAVMRLMNPKKATAIFVGDGFSDRYAVESADLVFAKNDLAVYCRDNSIEHVHFRDLAEVTAHIEMLLAARVFPCEKLRESLQMSI